MWTIACKDGRTFQDEQLDAGSKFYTLYHYEECITEEWVPEGFWPRLRKGSFKGTKIIATAYIPIEYIFQATRNK